MGSPSLPTPAETSAEHGARNAERQERAAPDLLVLDLGNAVAADYAAYARREEGPGFTVAVAGPSGAGEVATAAAVVLFLGPTWAERDRETVDAVLQEAVGRGTTFLGIVSSFRVHFGDEAAAAAEIHVLALARESGVRVSVFRPGPVLSPRSPVFQTLRRYGALYPLVPGFLRGCCVEGEELFAAIEAERQGGEGRPRTFTLLGANRPWREWLARHRRKGPAALALTAISAALAVLLIGHLAGAVFALLARRQSGLRCWDFDTLKPRSLQELLALCNKYNYRHVRVVGYNNGVVHFGHRHPGRTVVSTVLCNKVAHAGPGTLKADCGATVRQALDYLAAAGQELPVVPNYSYVCLGTAFFVPIHGSAADYSTVADTITRVVLYHPITDRLIAATRDDPAFRENVFNPQTDVVLLRLYLKAKPKARYFVRREVLQNPTAGEILATLRDTSATNVEIRKASAAGDRVTVARYYHEENAGRGTRSAELPESSALRVPSSALELPRDQLGRLWDRLEEIPVTSYLMHALTRHLAWHTELFFTPEEFATFWATHRALPLQKLQLRYIRRDGMPHSPFRDQDCVSIDLFLFRRHRRRFLAYLQATFPVVRANPGKHSR